MNSLKSFCSFPKCAPLALGQLEKDVEPLLGRELRVELIVGVFGRLEASKESNASVHLTHVTTRERDNHTTKNTRCTDQYSPTAAIISEPATTTRERYHALRRNGMPSSRNAVKITASWPHSTPALNESR